LIKAAKTRTAPAAVPATAPGTDHDAARRFSWVIATVALHLEELRYVRARSLGISGPQFLILMALADLDKGLGVSVRVVAKAIHVDPSFVTTQSKLLEKNGLVRRRVAEEDARVVQLSLTDKAYKQIAGSAVSEEALNDFIFAALGNAKLEEVTEILDGLNIRLEKACLRAASEL
jgi:DNA-binding MarR family transcriptional regulator